MAKIILTALVLQLSCDAGELPWLARSRCGTITESDAALEWNRLGQERRDWFLEAENPGEEFVNSLAMLQILREVASREGYMADPAVLSFRNSWLRTEAFIAWTESEQNAIEAGLTQDELRFCADHRTDTLWLSMTFGDSPDLGLGPFSVPDLPREIAIALYDAMPGATAPYGEGAMIRLDSVIRGEGSSVLPDSADIWAMGQGRIRFRNLADAGAEGANNNVLIDTCAVLAVAGYFAGAIDSLPADTVLRSSIATLTAPELALEMKFFETRLPVRSWEPQWVDMTVRNVLLQTMRASEIRAANPALMDSLVREADSYALDLALSALYRDSVTSRVSVTEADIQHEFGLLSQTVTIPEKRVLLALYAPPGMAEALRGAFANGNVDRFAEGLSGVPFLFGDAPPSRITPPLSFEDLPYGHREAVFSIPAGDDSWIGPMQWNDMPGLVIYRLVDVLPEHPAEPREIEPLLRQRAFEREQALLGEEWMERLGNEFDLELNRPAIQELPGDPDLWITLRQSSD